MSRYLKNIQKGYAIILAVAVLGLIAVLWLTAKQGDVITAFKNKGIEQDLSELKAVKQRLLEFSVLAPEIYRGVTYPSPAITRSLGPGYFPCPLAWTNCSTGGDVKVVKGFVPATAASSSESFHITEANRYIYYIDKRFMMPSADYSGDNIFYPLTPTAIADGNEPVMRLNGAGGYIALIIDPGSDGTLNEVTVPSPDVDDGLFDDTASGAYDFTFELDNAANAASDPTVDKIVGITYQQDWLPLMAKRVCQEMSRYIGERTDVVDSSDNSVLEDNQTDLNTRSQWFFDGNATGNTDSWFNWGDGRCP